MNLQRLLALPAALPSLPRGVGLALNEPGPVEWARETDIDAMATG